MDKFTAYAEGTKGGKDAVFSSIEDAREWAGERIENGYQWVEITDEESGAIETIQSSEWA